MATQSKTGPGDEVASTTVRRMAWPHVVQTQAGQLRAQPPASAACAASPSAASAGAESSTAGKGMSPRYARRARSWRQERYEGRGGAQQTCEQLTLHHVRHAERAAGYLHACWSSLLTTASVDWGSRQAKILRTLRMFKRAKAAVPQQAQEASASWQLA